MSFADLGLDRRFVDWPWLSRVLANKARDLRKRAARPIDQARLQEPLDQDPSEPAERRELADEVARAIDRLGEPYRQVVLLRLRHGLSLAEIADVLGRSPGTVRVQLHRAGEKLRPLLPGSLRSLCMMVPELSRGLPIVKGLVLHEALAGSGGLWGGPLLGVWIMSQKVLWTAAAALVLAAIAVWPLVERFTESGAPAAAGSFPMAAAPEGVPQSAAPADASNPLAAPPELVRSVVESDASAETSRLRGKVLDGCDGKPLRGVELRLHPPRRVSLRELQAERPELFSVRNNGQLVPRLNADWPRIEDSNRSRFGAEPVTVFGPPTAGDQPLATTHSQSDGSFSLPFCSAARILLASAPGYGERLRVIDAVDTELVLALLPRSRLSGQVLTSAGAPPPKPVELGFLSVWVPAPKGTTKGTWPQHAFPTDPHAGVHIPAGMTGMGRLRNLPQLEALGSWTARTDEQGRFSVDVAASEVIAHVLTPGYGLADTVGRFLPVDQPMKLVLVAMPVLSLFDAETQEPIERVRLLGQEQRNGSVRWSGEFSAPDGRLALPGSPGLMRSWSKERNYFTIWAEGYREAHFSLFDLTEGNVLEVPLERGQVPGLEGVILRSGKPVAEAQVALAGHSRMQWNDQVDDLVDAGQVDEQGRFRLEAGAGRYLLRVTHEQTIYFEPIELPLAQPLTIDLDRLGRIDLSLADPQQQPVQERPLALWCDNGRIVQAESDVLGRASFANLSAGVYNIMVARPEETFATGLGVRENLTLERGQQASLRIMIDDSGPLSGVIRLLDLPDYSGFRARLADTVGWLDVAKDGTLPLDLRQAIYSFEVDGPAGQRWIVPIPADIEDGHLFQLDSGEGSFTGILVDENGLALPGRRLFVTPWGYVAPFVSTITGPDGRFRVSGIGPGEHNFHLVADNEAIFQGNSSERMFRPALPAGEHPDLVIQVSSELPTVFVSGRVLRALDREPLRDIVLVVNNEQRTSDGFWRLGRNSGIIRTDREGHFELRRPLTSQLIIQVYGDPFPAPPTTILTFSEAEIRNGQPLELIVP